MALSTIKAVFNHNIQDVWNVVTSLEKYQWRSDLSKIDVISEKQFVELPHLNHPGVGSLIWKTAT